MQNKQKFPSNNFGLVPYMKNKGVKSQNVMPQSMVTIVTIVTIVTNRKKGLPNYSLAHKKRCK